jgi:hypothetical protein
VVIIVDSVVIIAIIVATVLILIVIMVMAMMTSMLFMILLLLHTSFCPLRLLSGAISLKLFIEVECIISPPCSPLYPFTAIIQSTRTTSGQTRNHF